MWNWLLHVTGVDNVSGAWYGWWSGFASDLGLLTVVVVMFKKVNCHVTGCWRLGLHHVSGTGYITCKKHHPAIDETVDTTPEHIADAHQKAWDSL